MHKLKYIFLTALACGSAACSSDAPAPEPITTPSTESSDLVAVTFNAPSNYGAPLCDSGRAGGDYEADLSKAVKTVVADGSSLWVVYCELSNVQKDGNGEITSYDEGAYTLKSYVVKRSEEMGRSVLYPCTVDDAGNVLYETSSPLYLKRNGYYLFRVMGPARKLTDALGLMIQNGEYVYSTDDRYEQTERTLIDVEAEIQKATTGQIQPDEIVVELNPMIYQVAQLKFTLASEEIPLTDENGNVIKDAYGNDLTYYPVHSIEVTNSGVVVTGLQDTYDLKSPGANWTMLSPYIDKKPGKVTAYHTIYAPTILTEHEVVFETGILPVDAVATPIIVEFYLRINGVPTQLQMMLNNKMFLHAYCYHYKGIISVTEGISILEWQKVVNSQSVEVDILPNDPNDR